MATRLATPLDASVKPLYFFDDTSSVTLDTNGTIISRYSLVGNTVTYNPASNNRARMSPASANTFPLTSIAYYGGQYELAPVNISGKTLTAFAVIDPNNLTGYARVMSFTYGSGNVFDWDKPQAFCVSQKDGTRSLQITHNSVDSPLLPYTDQVPMIVEVVFDGTNGTLTINGSTSVSMPCTDTFGITTAVFGAGGNGGDAFSGSQGTQLVYDQVLSAADRALIRGVLAWKYDGGVAGPLVNALPSNHPYKTAAPTVDAARLWTPDDLGNDLSLFIDASDTSTITYITGNYVNTISSKAGSVVMYAPDGAHTPPTITINGKTALQTSNNYGYLVSGGSNLSAFANTGSPGTLVFIGKADNGSAYNGGYLQVIGSTDVRSIGTVSTNKIGSPKGGQDIDSTTTYTANGNIAVVTYTPSGTNNTIQIYGDGVLSGSGIRPLVNEKITSVTMLPNGNNGGTGFLFAALYINRVLNTTDRQYLEGWAAWNYNMVSQLPANHPYKTAAPTIPVRKWTPTDIYGVSVFGWYRLRDPLGVVAQGADVFDGTNVTAWKDRSGKGNDLNPLYVPEMTYKPNGFGLGLATVRTSGFYGGTGWAGPITTNSGKIGAFAAVIQAAAQNTNGGRLISTGDVTAPDSGNQDYSRPNAIVMYNDGSTGTNIATLNGGYGSANINPDTPLFVGTYYRNPQNDTAGFELNGTEVSTYNAPYDVIPKKLGIGTNGAYKGAYWVGEHAEYVIFMGTLTNNERAKLEGYIAWNNGLTSSLPANHAYKLGAPTAQDTTVVAVPSINATSTALVSTVSSTSTAKTIAKASVNATVGPVISLTPKIATAPLTNGNFILAQDGSLLDKVWAVADANSTPNANGSTYSFTSSAPPSITPTIQPSSYLSFDGMSLLLGPLSPSANTSQLVTLTLRDQANAVVTSVPMNLGQIPTDDMVWMTFMFPTPIVSNAGTSWSINLSTESPTPLVVNGGLSSFAMLLRQQGLTIPPMNATQSFYVLPDCSGSTATGRTLTLNPDIDTSISKLVVSKGCSATFPSTNTYTLRVYDGIYDYTGTSSTDTGVDANSDSFQIINNDFDYGRSYALVDNLTSAGVIKAYASATANNTLQSITGSSVARAYASATSNATIGNATSTNVTRLIAKAASTGQITNVLSVANTSVYVSANSNATVDTITSSTVSKLIASASSVSTVDNFTQLASALAYVNVQANNTIDPVISVSASQEFVSINTTSSIGSLVGEMSGTVMVSGSGNATSDNITSVAQVAVPGTVNVINILDNVTQAATVSVLNYATVNANIDAITQTVGFVGYASANSISLVGPFVSLASGSVTVTSNSVTSAGFITSGSYVSVYDSAQATNSIGTVTSNAVNKAIVSVVAENGIGTILAVVTGKVTVKSESNSTLDPIVLTETTNGIVTASSNASVPNITSNGVSRSVVTVDTSSNVGPLVQVSAGKTWIVSNNVSTIDPVTSDTNASVTVTSASNTTIDNIRSTAYSGTSFHAESNTSIGEFTSVASALAIASASFNQMLGLPTMIATVAEMVAVQVNTAIGSIVSSDVISAIASATSNQSIGSFTITATAKAVPSLYGNVSIGSVSSVTVGKTIVVASANDTIDNVVSITGASSVTGATANQNIGVIAGTANGLVRVALDNNVTLPNLASSGSGVVSVRGSSITTVPNVTSSTRVMSDLKTDLAMSIGDVLSVSSGSIIVAGQVSSKVDNFVLESPTLALISPQSNVTISQIGSQNETLVKVSGLTNASLGAFVSVTGGSVRVTGTVPNTIDPVLSSVAGTVAIVGSSSKTFGNFNSTAKAKSVNEAVVSNTIDNIISVAEEIKIKHASVDATMDNISSKSYGNVRYYLSTGYQMLI